MLHNLKKLLSVTLVDLGYPDAQLEVELSDKALHGEYTTNLAMKLAKILHKPPTEIALQVKDKLTEYKSAFRPNKQHQTTSKKYQSIQRKLAGIDVLQDIQEVTVVPPGFINFQISEAGLSSRVSEVLKRGEAFGTVHPPSSRQRRDFGGASSSRLPTNVGVNNQPIMVEFAHPNTHKAFHIGHLRNITTGEALVRLLESQGHTVIRANYQGDVGMHIAKCLYGISFIVDRESLIEIKNKTVKEKVEFLGKAYAAGSKAFEEDAAAMAKIGEINNQIYAKDPSIYPLYQETRQWSLDYFDGIYKRVGSHFDRFYFESECLSGVDIANNALKKGILTKSQGAVVFDGKPYGLDTRVFINSLGLPTYEAKELALSQMEFTEFGTLDRLIHVVGPEQASFFKVTFKVEELLNPKLFAGKQHHLSYGWVKLKKGKMSSRLGNVVLGEWLIDEAKKKIRTILYKSATKDKDRYPNNSKGDEEVQQIAERVAVSAVKYAFLKVATNQEIAFDFDESISFDGDSGPYLLYTYARCKSVLRKAQMTNVPASPAGRQYPMSNVQLNTEEHAVARLIYLFPEIVAGAANNYAPNHLCRYLFQLAQALNLFYAKHKIVDSSWSMVHGKKVDLDRQTTHHPPPTIHRLHLTAATAQVLKKGLNLLGIETIERM